MVKLTIKVPVESGLREVLEDFMQTTYTVELDSVFLVLRKRFDTLVEGKFHTNRVIFLIQAKNYILEFPDDNFKDWQANRVYLTYKKEVSIERCITT